MKSPTLVSLEGDIAGEETAEWEKFVQLLLWCMWEEEQQSVCNLH